MCGLWWCIIASGNDQTVEKKRYRGKSWKLGSDLSGSAHTSTPQLVSDFSVELCSFPLERVPHCTQFFLWPYAHPCFKPHVKRTAGFLGSHQEGKSKNKKTKRPTLQLLFATVVYTKTATGEPMFLECWQWKQATFSVWPHPCCRSSESVTSTRQAFFYRVIRWNSAALGNFAFYHVSHTVCGCTCVDLEAHKDCLSSKDVPKLVLAQGSRGAYPQKVAKGEKNVSLRCNKGLPTHNDKLSWGVPALDIVGCWVLGEQCSFDGSAFEVKILTMSFSEQLHSMFFSLMRR